MIGNVEPDEESCADKGNTSDDGKDDGGAVVGSCQGKLDNVSSGVVHGNVYHKSHTLGQVFQLVCCALLICTLVSHC